MSDLSNKTIFYITIAIIIAIIILVIFVILELVGYDVSILAYISISVALLALVLGIFADRRVKDIANANFLRVLSIFEDRRIDLQYHPQRFKIHPILIWKALVDMRETEELLEFCDIDLKHQGRFIHLLNHLLKFINKYYVNVLVCEEVEHLLEMSLIGLQVDDEHLETKNAVRGRIKTLLSERNNVEITDEYIRGINNLIDEAFYKIDYLTLRDQIRGWYRQSLV